MRIGIDIDDTLTNTKEQQIKCWKEYYNNNPKDGFNEILPSNINEFNVDEYLHIFWDTYRYKLSFESSYKKDCQKYIDKLIKDGHELCIITSRPDSKYKNLKEEIKESFKKNNININLIYTDIRNKGDFCFNNNIDLLVDDDIKHITNTQNNGIKAILFNENINYKGLQVNNWKDLYNTIKTLN